jgi:hypothetical protein
VTHIEAVETHVPERAFAWKSHEGQNVETSKRIGNGQLGIPHSAFRIPHFSKPRSREGKGIADRPDRPSRLWDVPEPARVIALFPEGPPAWIEWRGRGRAVIASRGPERIALPWWREKLKNRKVEKSKSLSMVDCRLSIGKLPEPRAPALDAKCPGSARATLQNVETSNPKGRDYYEVQDEDGRWLWLFRNRGSGEWFVQGEWT